MSTIRRKRRTPRTSSGLTGIRKLILFHGDPILPCTPAEDFSNDAEAKATWDQHRDDLLSEYTTMEPGKRPWAWWKLDAREPCPGEGWYSQYDRLQVMNQIGADEALRFQVRYFPKSSIVDAEESASAVLAGVRESYRQRKAVRAFFNEKQELEGAIAEREFRLRWHRAKGEDLLVLFHQLVIAGLEEILKEENNHD